jgi:hypothetical protein
VPELLLAGGIDTALRRAGTPFGLAMTILEERRITYFRSSSLLFLKRRDGMMMGAVARRPRRTVVGGGEKASEWKIRIDHRKKNLKREGG